MRIQPQIGLPRIALDAEITLAQRAGTRTVKAADFFVDLLTTAMASNEILTEIRLPANAPRTGSAYLKVPQPASGFALTGVAAQVTLGANNVLQRVAVGITGISKSLPAHAKRLAWGQAATPEALTQAASRAVEGIDALGDIHASADYRLHLARVYTKRALQTALTRAQG